MKSFYILPPRSIFFEMAPRNLIDRYLMTSLKKKDPKCDKELLIDVSAISYQVSKVSRIEISVSL